jgi:hypothetical protein
MHKALIVGFAALAFAVLSAGCVSGGAGKSALAGVGAASFIRDDLDEIKTLVEQANVSEAERQRLESSHEAFELAFAALDYRAGGAAGLAVAYHDLPLLYGSVMEAFSDVENVVLSNWGQYSQSERDQLIVYADAYKVGIYNLATAYQTLDENAFRSAFYTSMYENAKILRDILQIAVML